MVNDKEDKTMKKVFLMVCAALVALVACEKQPVDVLAEDTPVIFNLDAIHPDGTGTKAVKTAWEENDVIFVFFSGQTAPAYLELKRTGSAWTSTAKNGLSLGVSETGTMRAVFLPFGNDASVVLDGTDGYKFSPTYYSYYLTDTQPYEVDGGQVSGTFSMALPDGFVQFFITDASASNGNAALREANLTPAGAGGISAGLALTQATLPAGAAMPGYVYSGGYLFSGLLADGAKNTSTDYDFGLVKGLSNKLATATGKTLYISDTSDPGYPARAANITGLDWTTDAPMQMVDLGLSSGTKWANMNLGASTETAYGSYYAWGEVEPKTVYNNSTYKWYSGSLSKYCAADGKTVLDAEDDAAWVNMGGSWRMPTKAEIEELVATKSNTTDYTWEKVGDSGWRVTRKSTGKSIFLPLAGRISGNTNDSGSSRFYFWSTLLYGSDRNYSWAFFYSIDTGNVGVTNVSRFSGLSIRAVSSSTE